MSTRTLVVISAGLSQPSSTRLLADRLAAAARDELKARGEQVDVKVVELRDHARDVVNHLVTGFPAPALREVIDDVLGADGLIVVTPIFKASYSGLFKAFFDLLDDASLAGKPVVIAATGGTARHSLALEHAVRPLFVYLRAVVTPTAVYAAPEDWSGDSTGDSAGMALNERIRRASAELADEVVRRQTKPAADPFALGTTFEDLLRGE